MPLADEFFVVNAFVHYTDGAVNPVPVVSENVRKYEPLYFPIGADAINYNFPGKEINFVELPSLGIIMRFSPFPERSAEFLYFTQSGALETLACRGHHTEKITDSAQEFRHLVAHNYAPLDRAFGLYQPERLLGGEARTGFFPNLDTYLASSELLRRLPAVKREGNRLRPVLVTSDQHDRLNSFDPLQGYTISYRYAETP
jgi:hypothetical protein